MQLHGTVESFDDARGIGVLRGDRDDQFFFHCVEIADGTRAIDVGVVVRALRCVGRLGHDEATAITKEN